MRCRKVRSFLSAYCNDELSGHRKLGVSDHLSSCSSCRKEEAIYYSINKAYAEIPGYKISKDFNNKLLNRIAQERFSETRTKAYLPKPAPIIAWGKALPAVVTSFLVIIVALSSFSPLLKNKAGLATADDNKLDDSYLTVQPINNPNLTVSMNKSWSLDKQMARAERINRISNNMTRLSDFSQVNSSSVLTRVSSQTPQMVPYVPNYYRMRPVIKIYVNPESSSGKEVHKVY